MIDPDFDPLRDLQQAHLNIIETAKAVNTLTDVINRQAIVIRDLEQRILRLEQKPQQNQDHSLNT